VRTVNSEAACLVNVGLDDRKVRPRFQHLKQKVTLLLVRGFSRSSGAIEHLSPVVNCIGHWAHPLDFKPHHASANQMPLWRRGSINRRRLGSLVLHRSGYQRGLKISHGFQKNGGLPWIA